MALQSRRELHKDSVSVTRFAIICVVRMKALVLSENVSLSKISVVYFKKSLSPFLGLKDGLN